MFDKAKQLYQLQKQARELKDKLAGIHVESEADGVTIVLSANLEVVRVSVTPDAAAAGHASLEKAIEKALSKGLTKTQEVAQNDMKDIIGMLGLGK